jgi:hypothetical protein
MHFELYNMIQRPDESLKDYIQRFSKKPNKISDITDDNIIAALTSGVRNDLLTGKFGCKPPKIVKQQCKRQTNTPS